MGHLNLVNLLSIFVVVVPTYVSCDQPIPNYLNRNQNYYTVPVYPSYQPAPSNPYSTQNSKTSNKAIAKNETSKPTNQKNSEANNKAITQPLPSSHMSSNGIEEIFGNKKPAHQPKNPNSLSNNGIEEIFGSKKKAEPVADNNATNPSTTEADPSLEYSNNGDQKPVNNNSSSYQQQSQSYGEVDESYVRYGQTSNISDNFSLQQSKTPYTYDDPTSDTNNQTNDSSDSSQDSQSSSSVDPAYVRDNQTSNISDNFSLQQSNKTPYTYDDPTSDTNNQPKDSSDSSQDSQSSSSVNPAYVRDNQTTNISDNFSLQQSNKTPHTYDDPTSDTNNQTNDSSDSSQSNQSPSSVDPTYVRNNQTDDSSNSPQSSQPSSSVDPAYVRDNQAANISDNFSLQQSNKTPYTYDDQTNDSNNSSQSSQSPSSVDPAYVRDNQANDSDNLSNQQIDSNINNTTQYSANTSQQDSSSYRSNDDQQNRVYGSDEQQRASFYSYQQENRNDSFDRQSSIEQTDAQQVESYYQTTTCVQTEPRTLTFTADEESSVTNASVAPQNSNQALVTTEASFNTSSNALVCEDTCECNPCCECCQPTIYFYGFPNQLYLGHTEGKGFGYDEGYTTLGVFLTPSYLTYHNWLGFFDIKGHCFNNGRFAANIGTGVRYVYEPLDAAIGFNIYYDYRNFHHHHSFNQVGLGFEYLSPCFDVRVNGYLPVGEKARKTCCELFDDYEGDFWAVYSDYDIAMEGVDAEIGTWLVRKHECNWFGLYVAGGIYYYHFGRYHHCSYDDFSHSCSCGCGGKCGSSSSSFSDSCGCDCGCGCDCCCDDDCGDSGKSVKDNTFGGKIRLAALFTNYIGINAHVAYDDYWKTTGQVEIVFSVPLDSLFNFGNRCGCECKAAPCNSIATQPVYRQDIITVDRQCCWDWNW